MSKLLSDLIAAAKGNATLRGSDVPVDSVSDHTKDVEPGGLFVCMPSSSTDTHGFIKDAAGVGASACLVHSEEGAQIAADLGLSCVLVPSQGAEFNQVVGVMAREILGNPNESLRMIGVTGTNGKTTTAIALFNALNSGAGKCAYMGTLGLKIQERDFNLNNTTPFPVEYWKSLGQVADMGADTVVLEVSSHALDQDRVAGSCFDVGVFTNLSQDHLDYHLEMHAYEEAKRRLFTHYGADCDQSFVSVLNVSDPVGARWADSLPSPKIRFGIPSSDVWIEPSAIDLSGIRGVLHLGDQTLPIESRLVGRYNLYNLESACATLHALGFSGAEIAQMVRAIEPVPGRFEVIRGQDDVSAIVDYAHTPDAVAQLLSAVREVASGRVVTVIGCGGDRDRSKRPKMAQAACSGSDHVVLTSDNPRTEDPNAILDEVETGVPQGYSYERESDRPAAIEKAVDWAQPGDVVVIAGKGHEDYQIIGRTKHHMDDRELARASLKRRSEGARA